MKMSKIVELKVEEIENVVGGIMAGTLSANASASASVRVPSHGSGANRPPMPAPESSHQRPHAKR